MYRNLSLGLSILVLVVLILVTTVSAQELKFTSSQASNQKVAAEREALAPSNSANPHEQLQKELINRVILERQLALKRDTEKLLTLAEELKQRLDKTSNNVLSLEVIKKAQEIQKLAKSVQDKMKEPY